MASYKSSKAHMQKVWWKLEEDTLFMHGGQITSVRERHAQCMQDISISVGALGLNLQLEGTLTMHANNLQCRGALSHRYCPCFVS